MLYKNTKAMVYSPDEDTDLFNIVAGFLQGDILVPYLFILCLNYILQTSIDLIKENGFTMKKASSRQYPAEPFIDADCAADLVLLANTSG